MKIYRPETTVLRLAIFLLGLVAFPANSQTSTKTRTSEFEYEPLTGLLVREVIEPGDFSSCLVTTYGYDAFGNRTSATTRNCRGIPFPDGNNTPEDTPPTCPISPAVPPDPKCDAVFADRSSTTSFAATSVNPFPGQFPTSSMNALGHEERREFNQTLGVMIKLTGPNDLVTTWGYDIFRRKTAEIRADGTITVWNYERCASLPGGTCPSLASYRIRVTASGAPTTSTYYDSLNRAIRTEAQGFDGNPVRKDTRFDALGRVAKISQPFVTEGTQIWTTYTYDILGRVVRVDEPATASGQARTETTYSGPITTITVSNAGSGAGMPGGVTQTETRTKNSQGQLISVIRQ